LNQRTLYHKSPLVFSKNRKHVKVKKIKIKPPHAISHTLSGESM
jgi:hypothetical protein